MSPRRLLKRAGMVAGVLLGVALLASGAGLLWLRAQLNASLPRLDGEAALPGASAPVVVARDDLGVPTLRGASRVDLARATGFLHAQDRFFQMDLLRRKAAGQLAELFGAPAVAADREVRVHGFRARAARGLRQADAAARELLAAYTAGVNAGLRDLRARPPEYFVLRVEPAPWAAEDSLLVLYAMYLELQGGSWRRESHLGLLDDLLPRELAAFLAPTGTAWDAPIVGEALTSAPIPPASVFDRRDEGALPEAAQFAHPEAPVSTGSNGWVVDGARSADGGALLANDMHLPLALPNIWYRIALELVEQGEARRLVGVTLPGAPLIAAGSNGRVAWGYTNSYGDWADLIELEIDPGNAERYMTPDGPRAFEHHEERIAVKGDDEVVVDVVSTIWGPVIDEDHRRRRRALRWVAHLDGAADLGLLEMERAATVQDALAAAAGVGIPAQNLMVADSRGSVGWTVIGPLPRRSAGTVNRPVAWREAGTWDGWLAPHEYPRVVDPPDGRLWTANNRVVDAEWLETLGDGGFDLGARAAQIRDGLRAVDRATVADMLAIQLDDRALFLERWRGLLLDVLTDNAVGEDPRRGELREVVRESWSGRAAVDSVGYRAVRAFRLFLARAVFEGLTARCKQADERFSYFGATNQWEGPLWRLVSERPPHLLDRGSGTWEAQLLAAVDETLDYFAEPSGPLTERTWGERNSVRIRHPFSLFVPRLARWLDAPTRALPGDADMPRVQGVSFGASQRMVVSPGREEHGVFHMPGGQSGHPRSPFYLAGHDAWEQGRPTPFLPGATTHTLILQ